MTEGIMTQLLQGIIGIAVILITGVLVPLLKQKYGIDKFQKAYSWTVIAVNAAEQMFAASGMGVEKYQYVADFLNSKGFNLTAEEVKTLIESAVKEINDAAVALPVPVEGTPTAEEIYAEAKKEQVIINNL